jgi:hypothetical protein
MKAIFIDAVKQEFREVEYDALASASGAPTMQDHLGGWIDCAFRFPNGDVLYVDEEGYLKPTMHFFICSFRADQPMAGCGIIVGREVEDDDAPGGFYTLPPQTKIDWLKRNIAWMTREGFDHWMSLHKDDPAGYIKIVNSKGEVVRTEVLHTYGELHDGMKKEADNDTGA